MTFPAQRSPHQTGSVVLIGLLSDSIAPLASFLPLKGCLATLGLFLVYKFGINLSVLRNKAGNCDRDYSEEFGKNEHL